ncbi:MAG: hypothetical protein JRE45_09170 [Deltaproteobacteria bacterium]|nr:hypothetical protein [Deltaproteobacteria bacterium]MBW1876123.1 hypothetical protein [Deltaproteobacteria bacterium]MBW2160634.1 hypothetical protein [Deltaproteobacteria bacterium]MBW2213215.1 hypothetical protein [Deltaproteobacteria bacterium]MBW2378307.1 hypothetical protein [Deltaproteobacteria bacterium]
MPFLNVMHDYFRGERIESLYFIVPIGIAMVAFAAVTLRAERGGFAWGLAVPLVLFGVFAIGIGAAVGLRTTGQVAELEAGFQSDRGAMVAQELPRMQKVNDNWPLYIGMWTTLVLVGLGLRFGLKADWAHGVGPAIILIGAMGFLIDGFAERRARPYTEALEALAAEQDVDALAE